MITLNFMNVNIKKMFNKIEYLLNFINASIVFYDDHDNIA